MRYRIKIERFEPPTQEALSEYNEKVRYHFNTPYPQDSVFEALSFECEEEQFKAIRHAALESMK